MPYDDPDPTDPMTLHSVVVETRDNSAMTDMAECFIDEYAPRLRRRPNFAPVQQQGLRRTLHGRPGPGRGSHS